MIKSSNAVSSRSQPLWRLPMLFALLCGLAVGSGATAAERIPQNQQWLAQLEYLAAAISSDPGSPAERLKRSGERLDDFSDGDPHSHIALLLHRPPGNRLVFPPLWLRAPLPGSPTRHAPLRKSDFPRQF